MSSSRLGRSLISWRNGLVSRPAKQGGCFERGASPIWTRPSRFVLFWSFLGLSRLFFLDLSGDYLRIFPIRPFPLPRLINSTYEEQSPKMSARQPGPFPKKVGNPRLWNPPVLASPQLLAQCLDLLYVGFPFPGPIFIEQCSRKCALF